MTQEWNEVIRVGVGLVCLLILMLGVRWQARTFRGDLQTSQRRMKSALAISVLCIVGVGVWAAFSLIDNRSNLNLVDAGRYVAGIGVLAAAFMFKTWLGPMLVSATASWAAYMFVEYREFRLIPIFEMLVDVLMDKAPPGAAQLFAAITLAHSALGAAYVSLRVDELR